MDFADSRILSPNRQLVTGVFTHTENGIVGQSPALEDPFGDRRTLGKHSPAKLHTSLVQQRALGIVKRTDLCKS